MVYYFVQDRAPKNELKQPFSWVKFESMQLYELCRNLKVKHGAAITAHSRYTLYKQNIQMKIQNKAAEERCLGKIMKSLRIFFSTNITLNYLQFHYDTHISPRQ